MSETLLVEACEGRHVPLHPKDAPNGSTSFKLKPGDAPVEVPNSTTIRRAIRSGDLKIAAAPAKTPIAMPATTSEK